MPVGARFFAPVQIGLGAFTQPPLSGYRISFPGIKRPGFGVNHPHSSSSKVKEIRAIPLRLMTFSRLNFTFVLIVASEINGIEFTEYRRLFLLVAKSQSRKLDTFRC
jgi:hypothetical protein